VIKIFVANGVIIMTNKIEVAKINVRYIKGEVKVKVEIIGKATRNSETISWPRNRLNIERHWDQPYFGHVRPSWEWVSWYCEAKDVESRRPEVIGVFIERLAKRYARLVEDTSEARKVLRLAGDILEQDKPL